MSELFPGAKLHFIGVGGIGMSGLALMCVHAGFTVTGSDRGSDRPENRRIFDVLKSQGVKVYLQDGSFVRDGMPDFLVYSTAIEESNPDFAAGEGIERLHRSALLAQVITADGAENSIAVTGSCGKSTVTAYLAETLLNLGEFPGCLNGALVNNFRYGNFQPGQGRYFVFEADESDKSLVNYSPDYAIILNMGTDHYDKEELARVFAQFLGKVKKGAVLENQVYQAVKNMIPPELPVAVFDTVKSYRKTGEGEFVAEFAAGESMRLPQPGAHMAQNALAILVLLERFLGFRREAVLKALEKFGGVWRRFNLAGVNSLGAKVYDDYAHNPEKIVSAIRAAREVSGEGGRVLAVFQPHGYGPLGFMRDELFSQLEKSLNGGDIFVMMEPYYAGGTSSFKPTAQEVITQYGNPERYITFAHREALSAYLQKESKPGDVIIVMGARDNSLSDYAKALAGN